MKMPLSWTPLRLVSNSTTYLFRGISLILRWNAGKPNNEDEELGFRDPAIIEGLLGFNNPKDSPELVLMQVQAQSEALAAKQKKMA